MKFLESEATYLNLLKLANQHIIKPFTISCSGSNNNVNINNNNNLKNNKNVNSNNNSPSNNGKAVSVASLIQRAKRSLLEAFLEITYAITSCVKASMDENFLDVSSSLPIVHQVCKFFLIKIFFIQYKKLYLKAKRMYFNIFRIISG